MERGGENLKAKVQMSRNVHTWWEGSERVWRRRANEEAEVVTSVFTKVADSLGLSRVTEVRGGLGHQYREPQERSRRMIGRKESVGLSLSELSLSMAYYGQSDKRNSDLGTQQIQVYHVAHRSPSGAYILLREAIFIYTAYLSFDYLVSLEEG